MDYNNLHSIRESIELDENSERRSPYFIVIAGGTASGKTTFCAKIIDQVGDNCSIFGFDSFYKGLPEGVKPDDYDFDHPNSIDFDFAYQNLQELKAGKDTKIPIYDFTTHKRKKDSTNTIPWREFVIIEGIFAFYDERIRNLASLKIFVQCDADTALGRRILRDIAERGRDHNEVQQRYNRFVKNDFEQYIKPYSKFADIIIPGGASNDIGVSFVMNNLKEHLRIVKYKKRGRKDYAYAKKEIKGLLEQGDSLFISSCKDRVICYDKEHALSNTHSRKLQKTLNHECKSEFIFACMKIFIKESVDILQCWLKTIKALEGKPIEDFMSLVYINEFNDLEPSKCKDFIVVYCPLFNSSNFSVYREIIQQRMQTYTEKTWIILSVFADSRLTLSFQEETKDLGLNIFVCGVFFLESVTFQLKEIMSNNIDQQKISIEETCFKIQKEKYSANYMDKLMSIFKIMSKEIQ